eukprot:TRINITY_DN42531_c0_g3_i1.p1 TRINITY_DN42531_c0_g3~~TRINITY_DN42531_c0_g3_i1.p1  ORF type:complete len:204 (-),score=81.50 TRINITY_DN42531_c0_g3_i1:155-766(-)
MDNSNSFMDNSNSFLDSTNTMNGSAALEDEDFGSSKVENIGGISEVRDNFLAGSNFDNVKEEKLYAPDSSSDEELDAEYANREVNLEESESEEEENGGYQFKRGAPIPDNINDSSPEEGPQEHLSSSEETSPTGGAPGGGLAATKSLLTDFTATTTNTSQQHSNNDNDDIADIDLSDPQLEVAATKIQSVFKGFQARKKMGKI